MHPIIKQVAIDDTCIIFSIKWMVKVVEKSQWRHVLWYGDSIWVWDDALPFVWFIWFCKHMLLYILTWCPTCKIECNFLYVGGTEKI
jgi:hypothetical protein